MILSRHVSKTTGIAMLGAAGLLLLLQVVFAYLGQLGELKDNYQAWDALRYVLWDAPRNLYQLLPVSALIGAVVGLGSLASSSELIVMRASGVSLWRIVGWVLRPAVLLMLASLALSEWVVPYASEQAKVVRSQANKTAAVGEVRGYWVRDNNRYVRVDYANSAGDLSRVSRIDLDQNQRLTQTMYAESGQYQSGQAWLLHDVTQATVQSDGSMQTQSQASLNQALPLQPRFVHLVTLSPEDLAPSQLWRYIRYLSAQGNVPASYRLALWQKLAAPFGLASLVVIACSFIFGPLRQQSVGFRLVISLFVGLGFSYLQDFLGYASLIYPVSAGWFVVVPIIVLFMIGGLALRRMR
jgi:lipopolysaccharide export system permease protein